MNSGSRACIAYIVARAISDSSSSHAYDYTRSKYIAFSGDVSSHGVNVYDYGRRCYCSGSLSQLYDYGNRKHIDLEIRGDQFSGFDYASGKSFKGSVSGDSVSLYDYETSQFYNFTV